MNKEFKDISQKKIAVHKEKPECSDFFIIIFLDSVTFSISTLS